MMAADTRRIRVGTLVTSLYFRQPVTFAKASVTVDHLSGGRVELALGVGDPSAGAKAGGAKPEGATTPPGEEAPKPKKKRRVAPPAEGETGAAPAAPAAPAPPAQ